jgi:hypothetical protein
MVIRDYIKCQTCRTPHTIRVSIGHNPIQTHTFPCVECRELLTIEMDVDFEKIQANIKCVNGCEKCNEEGTIVNLHPEFSIPEEHKHDLTFPWLADTLLVFQKQQELLGDDIIPKLSPDELKELYQASTKTIDGWIIIKKAWSLSINGQEELSKQVITHYRDHGFDSSDDLLEAIFHYFHKFINPAGSDLFFNACEILKTITRDYKVEFIRCKNYFHTLFADHMKCYFTILCEYFDNFSEYNQTLVYAKFNISLPEHHQASSIAFQKTKMFYGNAYEILTDHFIILACLNNIYRGRNFDQFEKMNLDKYREINKANKANPFKDTSSFFAYAKSLDSILRNASHHGAIQINNNTISFRSGGSGAEHHITYAQYLLKCNELVISMIALMLFEMVINYRFETK